VTVTEFLEARIAEDEAVARSALHAAAWVAVQNDHGQDYSRVVTAEVWTEPYASAFDAEPWARRICLVGPGKSGPPSLTHDTYDARHIARHNPARILAECAAKLRIVEEHRPFRLAETVCQRCEERGQIGYEDMVVEWPCPTVRALASIWSDHSDFREEWR
jgi:hypothetical protein